MKERCLYMKTIIKHCKMCEQNPDEYREYFINLFEDIDFANNFVDLAVRGYYTSDGEDGRIFCQVHPNEKLEISPLADEEYDLLSTIANDLSFIHAMEDLKQSDPIEFQLKMSQFKANLGQQESSKIQTNTRPKCPTCGSTNLRKVSATSKVTSVALWGLFSQKVKKTWHCNECGYEW